MSGQSGSPPEDRPRALAGMTGPAWLALALGLAIRLAMLLTGRSALDGDEAVMGVMGAQLARLREFPIYFYGQHYMGALETPALALIQSLGPAAWKFSVWPIRLTQAIYFVLFAWVHFRLTARFFGRRAAAWAVFFVAVGPLFWMDYSARLRHVVAMMAVGEAMALVGLAAADAWRDRGRLSPRPIFALGLLAGLGWWHYQLIAIYLGALGVTALAMWRGRGVKGAGSALVVSCAASLLPACALAGAATVSAPGSLGALKAGVAVSLFALGVAAAVSARAARRTGESGLLIPPALACGFALGFAPAWLHLLLVSPVDYWIPPNPIDLADFPGRVRDLFVLEISGMLEIYRAASDGGAPAPGARNYVNVLLYGFGGYVMLRALIAPPGGASRLGAIYFGGVLVFLVGFNAIARRPAPLDAPRFLAPLYAVTSVGLGLAVHQVARLFDAMEAKPRTWGLRALGAAAVAASLALWGPGWIAAPGEALDARSGHRAFALEIVGALNERGIERLTILRSPYHVLLSYELTFASRLAIRFNRADPLGDRFEGRVEESRYRGPEYLMGVSSPGGEPPRGAVESPGTFRIREYWVFPAPGPPPGQVYSIRARADTIAGPRSRRGAHSLPGVVADVRQESSQDRFRSAKSR